VIFIYLVKSIKTYNC